MDRLEAAGNGEQRNEVLKTIITGIADPQDKQLVVKTLSNRPNIVTGRFERNLRADVMFESGTTKQEAERTLNIVRLCLEEVKFDEQYVM